MALVGIPSYRLPRDILEREIEVIRALGTELKLNTRVGRDITLEEISARGFKAIFVATGAHLSREFEIENWKEGYEGLYRSLQDSASLYTLSQPYDTCHRSCREILDQYHSREI